MEPWTQTQADPSAEFIVVWIVRIVLGLVVFLLYYAVTHKSKPAPSQKDKEED